MVLRNRQALTTLERLRVLAVDPILSSLTVMHTLTCDSVLFIRVCFRAKGSGTGGVSCRERLGWYEVELKIFHTLYMTQVEKCHVPSIYAFLWVFK